jgi:hypothetical protein
MHTCMCLYIYPSMHASAHTYLCEYECVHFSCMHAPVHMPHVSVGAYACFHACMYERTHVHMPHAIMLVHISCMHVCMCDFMLVYSHPALFQLEITMIMAQFLWILPCSYCLHIRSEIFPSGLVLFPFPIGICDHIGTSLLETTKFLLPTHSFRKTCMRRK